MIKKHIVSLLVFAFLVPCVPVFAEHGGNERREMRQEVRHVPQHRDVRFENHRKPGFVYQVSKGLMFLYRNGFFYRHTPTGYVVVPPPVGVVLPALPPGCSAVVVNGVPYYSCGTTYYSTAPNGYVVTSAPVVQTIQPAVF